MSNPLVIENDAISDLALEVTQAVLARNPECRVSLVNPSGGSCRRTDSLLGDSL